MSYPFVQCHPKNYAAGRQGYADVWFVLHCTDDDYDDHYPANLGNYWRNNPVKVSVHFAVSDVQCYQYVDMNDTAFQARNPGNLRGVGIELSGLKSWTRNEWLAHRLMIRRAARVCAEVATARGYRIGGAVSRLGRGQLQARASGITQHADLTDTFGGSHTDLGDNFPWDLFWGELHKAYQPLAAQQATIAATRAVAVEEDQMAVTDAEFAALKNQVAQIHGVLVTGRNFSGSNLQRQLGYLGSLTKAVQALVEAILGHEQHPAAPGAGAPPTT